MSLPTRILVAFALLMSGSPDALAQSGAEMPENVACLNADDEYALFLTCEQASTGTQTLLVFDPRQSGDRPTGESCAAYRSHHFKSSGERQGHTFRVGPGQTVECAYASGHSVRVKAGVVDSSFHEGRCSGDPESYFSLWVDHRKLASRLPYSGGCRWLDRDTDPSPIRLYRITDVSIEECSLPERDAVHDAWGRQECRQIRNLAMHAPDEREYPEPGRTYSKPGTVDLIEGKQPVCDAAKTMIGNIWRNETRSIAEDDHGVKWLPRTQEIPLALHLSPLFGPVYESEFDFDNDGTADRVFSSQVDEGGVYWIPLLVQTLAKGAAASRVHSSVDAMYWSLPCQWNARHLTLAECQNAANYSGLRAPGHDESDTLDFFRAQYARLRPFRYGNETYVAVTSAGLPSRDYAAIVKPLPDRRYETACLFHRIPENF